MPKIELVTEIDAPIEICFDISRSIDLHKISTLQSKETAVAGITSGLIGLNETVTWRATHFGIRQQLTTKITGFDRPHYFKDEQLKGIFKSFSHEHIFEWHNGRTVMKDVFDFKSPGGIFGRLFNSLVLAKYMRRLLLERNEVIKQFAESGKWKNLPGM